MTINRLHGMSFRYLNQAEIKWLNNRRKDARPEVKALARAVFEEKFPRQARNEIKAQLHIKSIVFHVRGELYDEYGDEYIVNAEFTADTSGLILKKLFGESETFVEEKSIEIGVNSIRKLFNIAVHNYDISFWDEDLPHEISYDPDIDLLPEYRYENSFDFDDGDIEDDETDEDYAEQTDGTGSADEPDDRIPAWSVEIKYKNGKEQTTKGYDYLPDPVMELFGEFDFYFIEEDMPDGEFDEDDCADNI